MKTLKQAFNALLRACAILAAPGMLLAYGIGQCKRADAKPTPPMERDTVRIVVHDTVRVASPMPGRRIALEPIVAVLRLAQADTVPRDSVAWAAVEVPMERTVYEDTAYRAVVSGYMASLDTIEVYPRREAVTVTERVAIPVKPPSRWCMVAGVGIGATPKGIEPMLGVTVGYRIW